MVGFLSALSCGRCCTSCGATKLTEQLFCDALVTAVTVDIFLTNTCGNHKDLVVSLIGRFMEYGPKGCTHRCNFAKHTQMLFRETFLPPQPCIQPRAPRRLLDTPETPPTLHQQRRRAPHEQYCMRLSLLLFVLNVGCTCALLPLQRFTLQTDSISLSWSSSAFSAQVPFNPEGAEDGGRSAKAETVRTLGSVSGRRSNMRTH